MFGPRRQQKTYVYYRQTDSAGSDINRGAAAPSASTPPSAESGPASDGDMVGGSPPRRKMSAPRLGHRRQGLLQEPGPSRRLDQPLRSLSQLTPEDISPAHGLGSPNSRVGPASGRPGQVPAVAATPPRPGKSPAPGPMKFSSPADSASVHAHTAASGSSSSQSGREFSLTKQEKPLAARPTEPRDSYASEIRIPHSSPSAHSHLVKAVQLADMRVLVLEIRKNTVLHPKYLDVQAPTATMNIHRHSRCHYKWNSGSTPAGTNNPPHRRACGTTTSRWLAAAHSCSSDNDLRSGRPNSSSDDLRADAAATRPSPMSLLDGRGQAIKAKEPEARSADGADDPVGDEAFSSCHNLSTNDGSYLPAGRSPLKSSRTGEHRPPHGGIAPKRGQDSPRTRTSP
jgi:hypothetical protein